MQRFFAETATCLRSQHEAFPPSTFLRRDFLLAQRPPDRHFTRYASTRKTGRSPKQAPSLQRKGNELETIGRCVVVCRTSNYGTCISEPDAAAQRNEVAASSTDTRKRFDKVRSKALEPFGNRQASFEMLAFCQHVFFHPLPSSLAVAAATSRMPLDWACETRARPSALPFALAWAFELALALGGTCVGLCCSSRMTMALCATEPMGERASGRLRESMKLETASARSAAAEETAFLSGDVMGMVVTGERAVRCRGEGVRSHSRRCQSEAAPPPSPSPLLWHPLPPNRCACRC
eukprot:5553520-Pleurochrysis_carterae.AAC.2